MFHMSRTRQSLSLQSAGLMEREECGCCLHGRIRVFGRGQDSVWCHCCDGTGFYDPTIWERVKAYWTRLTTDYYKVIW